MAYSRAFFDLQIQFAEIVCAKFRLDLPTVLFEYTTFSKTLASGDEWNIDLQELKRAQNLTECTYQFYLPRRGSEVTASTTTFHGHRLFGCFYFETRDTHIIRPHFIKNGNPEEGWLNQNSVAKRRAELRDMFTSIQHNVPEADTVLGNSWMYNLEAYRRLYPPAYTHIMEESLLGEFQFLARWGQFFDKSWNVKPDLAQELFRRIHSLNQLEELRKCVPFQILRPRCSIERFYESYNI